VELAKSKKAFDLALSIRVHPWLIYIFKAKNDKP
jgi:hypothetical protein